MEEKATIRTNSEEMASPSFRDSINSLGWSRRDQDVPVNTSQQSGLLSSIKSLNPFGDNGYVRLPTTESSGAPLPAASRREEEEGWFVRESAPPMCPNLLLVHLALPILHLAAPAAYPPLQNMCRICAPVSHFGAHEHFILPSPVLSPLLFPQAYSPHI